MYLIDVSVRQWKIVRGLNKIKTILTSYEIVCATLRRAPRRAYFELDDHPAPRVVYTFRLEMHRKNSAPIVIKNAEFVEG